MKRTLALVLALVMVLGMMAVPASAAFTDAKEIEYKEAVDVVAACGIIDGFEDGSFDPTGTLTREQAAKVVAYMLLGQKNADALKATTAPFEDVAANRWSAGYIAYVANEGIINGRDEKTFDPTATVTGLEFAKLMLGALGYDAAIEEFTGKAWSVNVGKIALDIDLFEGNEGADYNAPCTREEAALYILNTLKADLVDYETRGTEIDLGNGIIINTGASKAKVVTTKNENGGNLGDVADNNGNYVYQFAEKYFSKLVLTSSGNNLDNYGRPSVVWTYDSKKVGTYDSKNPVLTLTTVTKEKDIFSALGVDGITGTYAKYVVMDEIYVDGELNSWAVDQDTYFEAADASGDCAEAVIIAKGDTSKTVGTGEGVLVEIYKTDNANHYEMVVIHEYLAKVNSITKADANADKKRTINTAYGSFETEDFAKGDYVIVTLSNGTIKTAVAAEKVEDVAVTSYKDNSFVVGDGVKYKYSQTAPVKNTEFKMTDKDSYSFYLDTYGNIIKVDEYSVSNTDYVLVLAEVENKGDAVTGQYTNVKYIDATGKTAVVKTYGATNNVTEGAWYTVTTDDDHDGHYKFTAVNTTPADETVTAYALATLTNNKLVKTQPKITDDLKANAGTVFVLKTDSDTWKVYEGIASVPSYAKKADGSAVQATGVAGKDGYADIIYIDVTAADAENSSADDVVYVLSTTPAGKYYDSENKVYYNELNAIVNGEKDTIKVAVDGNRDNVSAVNHTGLVKIDTYDSNGYISKTTELQSDGYAKLGTLNNIEIKYSEPTLSVGDAALSAADAVVYMIDSDDVLTVGSVDDLVGTTTASNSNVMYVVYASKTDSTVEAIYFDGSLK